MVAGVGSSYAPYGAYGSYQNNGVNRTNQAVSGKSTEDLSTSELKQMKRTGEVECSTCASRKYQDGSDEQNVSFKAAAHISPSSAGSRVMAHEQEHVNNAYSKAAKNDGNVVSASVRIKTAVCPECGENYVSGGVTNTTIKYNEDNPYGKNKKSSDYGAMIGGNIDYAV